VRTKVPEFFASAVFPAQDRAGGFLSAGYGSYFYSIPVVIRNC